MTLLIVVDMQNDFVTGALGTAEAQAIVPHVNAKIAAADAVVYTLDTHGEDYLSTQEGRKLPVPHCMKNSEGWQLYGRVAALKEEGDRCFDKPCFGSWELGEYARQRQFDKIELCGVVSNICVLSNAVLLKAALPEAQLVVDARCVASNDDKANEEALDMLQSVQVEVVGR